MKQVHRFRGEMAEPSEAVCLYEQELNDAFGLEEGQIPQFDLVLLGLGTDGHVASLFPGSPAVEVQNRLATEASPTELKTSRISLTLLVLNNARCCLFIVSGELKRAMLQRILRMSEPDAAVPASLVHPSRGDLIWIVDKAAYGVGGPRDPHTTV